MSGWDFPKPFLRESVVGAEHIDGLEHTNNTVYVRWCEEAAWAHSEFLGLDIQRYRELDRAMAVVEGLYRYLQAARLGDELHTATWIANWDGRLSMTRHLQIRRSSDGVTLLRGRMRFACIEISSGRPRRMPREFIDGYGPAILGLPDEELP